MSRINGFVGRRNFLKLAGIGSVAVGASAATSVAWQEEQAIAQQPAKPDIKPQLKDPQEALKRLIEGNQRFVEDKRMNPNQSKLRLQETALGQYPFAAILGCADSRVPAEIVFDQGLGDLFVVRLAGNVVSQEGVGSLEFATAVLGAPLIVVLGHTKCGAVSAAVKGDPLPGRIGIFVEEIKPSVELVRDKTGNLEDNSVISNVKYQVRRLEESSTILKQLIKENKLKIAGGSYDVATGKVKFVV
ncbi:twin-arginine translocation signal domain-containing protein [Nostoc sp. FACHB-87]|uniref:carbonic anhydrase n=1 Tax=Nostocales TaxID=1161 RepID=UPI0016896AEA|nr:MULTISPECIES: carbonic anhydrase [Nostocales]MBD2457261.1 twin-arginine translocation signal domain-containing protein [Nostoc sp. FACHB-87]MBD2475195.1 twin-arginine translocation signal domain-containing protein [Anabaena sp. FACHB-83]MBD2489097.1 twin-arginine translocation signal domain-containing protein [Aulosira sp. FACHB-615]